MPLTVSEAEEFDKLAAAYEKRFGYYPPLMEYADYRELMKDMKTALKTGKELPEPDVPPGAAI